jgi:hypothetical protein
MAKDIRAYLAKFVGLASASTVDALAGAKDERTRHQGELSVAIAAADDADAAAQAAVDTFAGADQQDATEAVAVRAGKKVERLHVAIAKTDQRIATLEVQAAKETEAANRASTAAAIEKHIAAKTAWDSEILDVLERGQAIQQRNIETDGADSIALAILCKNLPPELLAAFAPQTQRLRERLRDTLSGNAPELLPAAAAAEVKDDQPAQAVAQVAVYSATVPLVYTDVRDGKRKAINRGGNVYLTVEQAELAGRKAVPFDTSDKQQLAWRSISGSTLPEAHLLFDLDTNRAPDRSAAGMKTLSHPTSLHHARCCVYRHAQHST